MNNSLRYLMIAAVTVGVAACAPKKTVKPDEPAKTNTTTATTTTPKGDGKYSAGDLDTDSCLKQRVVYFDFDKAEVRAEANAILKCHAKFLNDVPSARINLEGNADERGTREYNLGLGERRGKAVQGAMQANGASSGQMNVVSYGEERPVCTESNESCWQKNRRVEIVYTAR
jgi:peptidoglycan-associated lipoprotein